MLLQAIGWLLIYYMSIANFIHKKNQSSSVESVFTVMPKMGKTPWQKLEVTGIEPANLSLLIHWLRPQFHATPVSNCGSYQISIVTLDPYSLSTFNFSIVHHS